MSLEGLINLHDVEAAAHEKLPPVRLANVSGGACDEITMRDNIEAFDRWRLLPRVMTNIDDCSTEATVLGVPVSLPVLVAPSATHALYHPEGELATARGAADAGAICVISVVASCPAAEIAAAAPGAPRFFMYSATRDKGLQSALIEQAHLLGASALVLCVDSPMVGKRERADRAGHETGDLGLLGAALGRKVNVRTLDMRMPWEELPGVIEEARLPVVIKGILSPADAARACELGAAAVIVSNHGGRQLDSVPATLDALPAVVEAVAGRAAVLMDGGVRRGTDVAKALAFGAEAVMIGRPAIYGLALAGADGVRGVLQMLQSELLVALGLMGLTRPSQLGREHVVPARAPVPNL